RVGHDTTATLIGESLKRCEIQKEAQMRFTGFLFVGLLPASILPDAVGQEVTIAQLRSFLVDQHRLKQSDPETADRLSSVWLSERLTGAALRGIIIETGPGPEAVEQLRLLADGSMFAAPVATETPTDPRPSP